MTTGFLHPGAMGATIAGACAGDTVWASDQRSPASADRAAAAGLADVGTLDAMAECCDTIVAVCPPDAASAVADAVAATGFRGRYVDANAIAPDTARSIADRFERFVDGGIIGSPPAEPGRIRLYLSGAEAADVGNLWAQSPVEVRVVDGDAGAASAVKMAYAGWTKGSAALLLTMRAFAASEGVEADLLAEWATSIPDLPSRSEGAAAGTAPKAWRFVGEMHEIAAAVRAVGGPGEFHEGAAAVYATMADFKNAYPPPELSSVLAAITKDLS